MYLEFLFVLFFYIISLKCRDFLLEIVIPAGIALAYYFLSQNAHEDILKESLSFLRILLGFTMASLALFLTKNPNLEEVMQCMTERYVNNKQLSLYEYIVLSFTYLIIIESFIHFFYFLYKLRPIGLSLDMEFILKAVYVYLFFHILLATIRAITEVYQTLIGRKKNGNNYYNKV